MLPCMHALDGITHVIAESAQMFGPPCSYWLRLQFFPIKFVGCWQLPWTNVGFPFGWQGIVPWKGLTMGRRACALMTDHLVSVDEVFGRLDAAKLAEAASATLDKAAAAAVDEAAKSAAPALWATLPDFVRHRVLEGARAQVPIVLEQMCREMRLEVARIAAAERAARHLARGPHGGGSAEPCGPCLFSLERLVCRMFAEEPEAVSAMFIQCGFTELIFIRNMGALMGGVLGVVQALCYAFYRGWWLLPTFGLVAGAATNWLAMCAIFYPFYPTPLCPCGVCGVDRAGRPRCVVQGLFIRRQPEVAARYARIVASGVLTPRRVLEELLHDGVTLPSMLRAATRELASAEAAGAPSWLVMMRRLVDAHARGPLSATPMAAPPLVGGWELAAERAADALIQRLPEMLTEWEGYVGGAMDLERTLRERMAALPPEVFEALLHSIFREDEWKLIAVGGALGVTLGMAQAYAFGQLGLAG